jgi:AraC family transcriptional regulator
MLEEFSTAAQEPSADSHSRYPLAPRGVQRALDFIHANLATHIRLEDMAGAARMSVFHFSRTFRRATGTGPHRYLVEARIERVKALLRSSDRSLAQIADETGFSDQSHMSKVFRRLTGTSPRAFRVRPPVARCPLQAYFETLHRQLHAARNP